MSESSSKVRLVAEHQARKSFGKRFCIGRGKSPLAIMMSILGLTGAARATGLIGPVYEQWQIWFFAGVFLFCITFSALVYFLLQRQGAWSIAIGPDKICVNPRSPYARPLSDKTHAVIEIPQIEIDNLIIVKVSGGFSWFAIELKNQLPDQIVGLIKREQKKGLSTLPRAVQVYLVNENRTLLILWQVTNIFKVKLGKNLKEINALANYPVDREINSSVLAEFSKTHPFLKKIKKKINFKYEFLKGLK